MARRDRLFVDTGVWYAALVAKSAHHKVCEEHITNAIGRHLTTDYVVDELVTLLVARGHREAALTYVPLLLNGSMCELVRVTEADFFAAWRIIQQFSDKRWSFTDCTSYAVMQRLGITEALALDDHFRQFGFAAVKP